MSSFPPCPHAGRMLTGRRFCRHPEKPQTVTADACQGCRFAGQAPPECEPPCQHRGEPLASIIGCQCPESHQKPVFACALHGPCVLSRHNRENVPAVACCATCPDQTTNPPAPASVDQLAIIAVHYNPQRYCLPLRNYWEWRHHLGPLQQQLRTVELSFDGHFAIHDAEHITGGPQNVMWQKEAMINHAIRSLPQEIRFVAWIDHDLIFENEEWAAEAVDMLANGYDAVQLFETWEHLGPTDNVVFRRNGSAAAKIKGQDEEGPVGPGGAWAARRDYLERIGGLACSNIVGGGDQLASDAWLGNQSHYMERFAGRLASYDQRWQHQARAEMKGKTGFIAGNVRHLYHGDRSKRGYVERAEILRRHSFDPEKDIRIAPNGILEWCSNKPQLHQDVADYFASREEDE